MRIIFDARMLFWTGVGRYTKRLLECLEEIDPENEYLVLVRAADFDKWSPKAPNFKRIEANINPYTMGEQVRLPSLIKNLKPDLVHFPAPNSPLSYRGKKVVTVHDLTLVDFDTSRGQGMAKAVRRSKRAPYRVVFKSALETSEAVITDTKFVKEQLINRYKVIPDKVHPIILGADIELAKPEDIGRFKLGEKFLLYAGNYFPYKNVTTTVDAFAKLSSKYPDLKLVLAGHPDYFQTQLKKKVGWLGLSDKVAFVGFVTDGELTALYRAATLYVNPSLSEGFGLQGLEAMSESLPVVASRATSLPEVYGDAAEYFDPHDASDQAAVIDQLLGDESRRKQLAELGRKRVQEFDWKTTAQKTLAVYSMFSPTS